MLEFSRLATKPLRHIRAAFFKRKLTNGAVHLSELFCKVTIQRGKNSRFIVNGTLDFTNTPQIEGQKRSLVRIILEDNATFEVNGNLSIVNGVAIYVKKNGILKVGDAGIIINASIAVYGKVEIGSGCMISSGVSIMDSSWHYTEYDGVPSATHKDVAIGNHVWLCPASSIMKGAIIGDGCIVGTRSLVCSGVYPTNSLISGVPAVAVKNNCKWKFEL
jgi:acetyltransferase-like isoleucine patch superfamily enzyme